MIDATRGQPATTWIVAVGVLVETAGRKRDRWYSCHGYLERLRVGTELDVPRRSPG